MNGLYGYTGSGGLSTNAVKNALLRYFRFGRGFPYVATECWEEDIVASDGVRLTCVEIKVSWADYRREFGKSKHKRESCYWHPKLPPKSNNPNRIFFAAPSDLAARIAEDLQTTAPVYGVLSVDAHGQVSVIRKAQELHKKRIDPISLRGLVMRLTSELITMREQVRA